MKPERLLSILFGLGLILIGGFSLLGNFFLSTEAWRLWPIIVIMLGMVFVTPGLFGLISRGFGAFFIPGMPILTTGAILMFASLFQRWDVWAFAWPFEVLAVATGFLLAAIFMRVPGLLIPASIVGVNGVILLFCNSTGLWSAWALLWPAEFLAIGLGLLLFGIFSRSGGAITAAVILFCIAGGGFFIMSFFSVLNLGILKFAVPGMLILTGLMLTALAVFRKNPPAQPLESN